MLGIAVGTPYICLPSRSTATRSTDAPTSTASADRAGRCSPDEQPWEGESLYSVIYKQKNDRLPTLRRIRTDVPARLAFAIEGAMAKDPDERWASASEFLRELPTESWAAALDEAAVPSALGEAAAGRSDTLLRGGSRPRVGAGRGKDGFLRRPSTAGASTAGSQRTRRAVRRGLLGAGTLAGGMALAVAAVSTSARQGLLSDPTIEAETWSNQGETDVAKADDTDARLFCPNQFGEPGVSVRALLWRMRVSSCCHQVKSLENEYARNG